MTNKKPHRETGIQVRDVWYSESDPGETRTHDQWLKRPLLYQLSYRIINGLIMLEKSMEKLC